MPAGSIAVTFAASCGCDWIFVAIGEVVVPPFVVPPVVVPPVVVPPVVVPPVLVPPVVDPPPMFTEDENELTARPAPFCQGSKPAWTLVRYQEFCARPRLIVSLANALTSKLQLSIAE